MGKYTEKVEQLFTDEVSPRGLPPRLAGNVKKAMLKSAKKSAGNAKAIKKSITEYMEERGYDPKTNRKVTLKRGRGRKTAAKKTRPTKKSAKEDRRGARMKTTDDKKSKDPAKDAVVAAAGKKAVKGNPEKDVPAGNIDLGALERQTLKGMTKDLGLTYKKSFTDDELRKALAAKLIGGGSDKAILDKLKASNADPAKLSSKIDGLDSCVGILLNLSEAVCITCPKQEPCRQKFEENRANGFKNLDALMGGATPLIPVEAVTAKKDKKAKKEAKAEEATLTYAPFEKVKDLSKVKMEGERVKNFDHKEFLRAINKKQPKTRKEFDAITAEHYEENDGVLNYFFEYAKKLGIVK